MPLITHADSWHAHAASGAAWLASAYPILFFSWYAAYADPSAFGLAPGLSLPLCLCLIAGVTTSATGYPMRPKKHFPHYTGQMRNSMLCTSLSALLVATFAAEPHLPPPLVAAAHAATALGAGLVAYDAVVARTPWDISQVVIDLKLELPPRAAILAANTISLGWLAIFAAAVSNVLLGGASAHDLLGSAGPEGSAAFAAQMALALALAPASEALVGTSMQKDRFDQEGRCARTRAPARQRRLPTRALARGVRASLQCAWPRNHHPRPGAPWRARRARAPLLLFRRAHRRCRRGRFRV